MEKSIYSSSWYRVAQLRPRLRSHARIHRQHYRKQLWYVLQDRSSGRFHRFSPSARFVISLMDGRRTVQEIWDQACSQLGDDALIQDEMIKLLAQLHTSDVLYGDVPADLGELAERAGKQRRRKLVMSFMNPLALRIPLFDPDRFLNATFPLVRPLFSWFGAALFLVVIGYALLQAGAHWSALTENISDRVLAAESLMLLILTYPFVKALHELGHGYAVKKWGGEVHEIGVMFLVFMPVPYVDATAAAVFHDKWRRALVGAAGILVELLLAALALFIWINAEEGLVRAFAFNVMLIGGVSTLLFNGNPLLRFDGYYVLSDLLEIPNLGIRSNRYIAYLIQRYLFGVENAQSPVTARGEPAWLFCYSVASFCYRIFIVTVIVTFVATRFFVIGVLMAIWSVVLMLGVPLVKQLIFLFTSPVLARRRNRAIGVSAGVITGLVAALLLVPMPYSTVTEGVMWVGDDREVVHAGAEGLVSEVLARPNSYVSEGEPLIRMQDPLLDARVRILEARVHELQLRHAEMDFADLVEARIAGEQLRHAEADLELALKRRDDLLIRSQSDGQFILPRDADLPGRFVRKGDVLGYTARLEDPVVRVIVEEDQADFVRHSTRRVEVRFVERMAGTRAARVAREVPALSDILPSMALSTLGGGNIVLDPTSSEQMTALARLLHLELKFDSPQELATLGERVYVRFNHGFEPLAGRMYRSIRRVFLRRFNV